jgi:hypothetical protein
MTWQEIEELRSYCYMQPSDDKPATICGMNVVVRPIDSLGMLESEHKTAGR